MIEVQVRATIDRPPEDVLDFVMDIERYAEVDRKIHPVLWVRRETDAVVFACRPTLAGLPQPAVVQRMDRSPGRIDISLCPAPYNRLARSMAGFRASFACAATADGRTELIRTLRFDVRAPLRWVLEPWLRRRLPAEVREEVDLARRRLEG